MKKVFRYPAVFPNEAFTQSSIETYFERNGFTLFKEVQADLIAERSGEKWFIEAKGVTTDTGTDFNTALGQLLKWMSSPEYTYALALPKHPKCQRQCNLLPQYVRKLLHLRILVVDDSGGVACIAPDQEINDFFAKEG